MTDHAFDSILAAENTAPSKTTVLPRDKVQPYVPRDEFTEAIIAPVNDYRAHPQTVQFVQAMSNQSKEISNA